MSNKKNQNPIERLCGFAFRMAITGICTVGICPAFGAMAISIVLVMKRKNAPLNEELERKNQKSLIGGIISILLFAVDIAIILIVKNNM